MTKACLLCQTTGCKYTQMFDGFSSCVSKCVTKQEHCCEELSLNAAIARSQPRPVNMKQIASWLSVMKAVEFVIPCAVALLGPLLWAGAL